MQFLESWNNRTEGKENETDEGRNVTEKFGAHFRSEGLSPARSSLVALAPNEGVLRSRGGPVTA